MRTNINKLFCMLLFVMSLTPSMQTQAVTTFARETGMPCAACHFQNFPALNSMGRYYKSNGYTLMAPSLIGASPSSPFEMKLNAGIVSKIRYQQSNGPEVAGSHTTNDGQWQFPNELLINIGARISPNLGAVVELDLNDASPLLSGLKFPALIKLGNSAVGAIPFSTSSQGASYGFELMNTGAVRFSRVAEDRSAVSAQQYIGTATKAQGVAFVASDSRYFANFSKWSPRTFGDKSGAADANYLRLAFTPQIGKWDTGVGVQSWSGRASLPDGVGIAETDAWAVDFQAQGAVGEKPLGVYVSHARAAGTPTGSARRNLFNANPHDRSATAVVGQLGVIPGKGTILLSYRKGDNGRLVNSTDNAVMIGGTYLVWPNVQLQLNHTEYSGSAYRGTPVNGTRMTTLMLYTAF